MMISLGAWAKRHGKSKSAAMRLYLQQRIPGAQLTRVLGVEVIGVPEETPWPTPAARGELTDDQRSKWPRSHRATGGAGGRARGRRKAPARA